MTATINTKILSKATRKKVFSPFEFFTFVIVILSSMVRISIVTADGSYNDNINNSNKKKNNIRIRPVRNLLEEENHQNNDTTTTTSATARIVGGTHVSNPNQYPFFVSWGYGECGGTLIHSDIVLTAGHCSRIKSNRVVVNAYQMNEYQVLSTTQGAHERTIIEKSLHPGYNLEEIPIYDFALLHLDEPVHSNNNDNNYYTVPYTHDVNMPSDGMALTIIGFGVTSEDGDHRYDILQEATVTKKTDATCDKQYANVIGVGEAGIDENIMFCASSIGKDSCQGDSGGPILRRIPSTTASNPIFEQVGVVSFGVGCAHPNYPGIYAKTSAASSWIQSEICRMSVEPPSNCFLPYECHDTFGDFSINSIIGEKSCEWLQAHLEHYSYMCNFMDIALACPLTCGSCTL